MFTGSSRCPITLAAALALAGSVAADQLHVPADYPTISAAILAAGPGDEIVVAPGVYRERLIFGGSDIVLRSSGGPGVTFISGDLDNDGTADSGPLLEFALGESNAMVVQGFTLIDGYTDEGYGAAVSIVDSSPTLRDVVVTRMYADGAAAVDMYLSSAVFERVRFIGNDAPGGAGAVLMGVSGSPIFRSCLFAGNFADGGAGAVSVGGLVAPLFVNCVFSGNGSDGGTSGIDIANAADVTVANCTFNENLDLSGARRAISVASSARALVTNSIFRADGTGPLLTGSALALTVRNCNIQGGFAPGTGIIDADPLFADAAGPDGVVGTDDDDLRLLAGSPSIDAGDNADVPPGVTTDADGLTRIIATVDHGAYEFQSAPCAADYDGNGEREVADIFAFLSDWFADVPAATEFGGTPGVPAIFAFLTAWFAGCP